MKSHSVLLRIPAIFLSIALGAPAPVLALRPLNAGAEESPTRTTLSERISPAGGAEEAILLRMGPAEVGAYQKLLGELRERSGYDPDKKQQVLQMLSDRERWEGVPWLDNGIIRIGPLWSESNSRVRGWSWNKNTNSYVRVSVVIATLEPGTWDTAAGVQLFGTSMDPGVPRKSQRWHGQLQFSGKMRGRQKGRMSVEREENGRLILTLQVESPEDLAGDLRFLWGTLAHLSRPEGSVVPLDPIPFQAGWLPGVLGIAYDSARQNLFVVARSAVIRMDPVTGQILDKWALRQTPSLGAGFYLQMDEREGELFLLEAARKSIAIYRLDPGTVKMKGVFFSDQGYETGLRVSGFAYDSKNKTFLILENEDLVSVDARTSARKEVLEVSLKRPLGMAYDSGRRWVYVIQHNPEEPFEWEVAAFDLRTGRPTGWAVPFEGTPQQIAYDAGLDRVMILSSNGLRLADPESGRLTSPLKEALTRPRRVAHDPRTRTFFLSEEFVLPTGVSLGRVRAFSSLTGLPVSVPRAESTDNPMNLLLDQAQFLGTPHRTLQFSLRELLSRKDAAGNPVIRRIEIGGVGIPLRLEPVDTVIEVVKLLDKQPALFERDGDLLRITIQPAPAAGAEEQPTGRRKWTVEKVVEVIRRASASERPKLSLASGAIVSKSQRASNLGKDLYNAYVAVVNNKSFPADLPDWPAALRKAGEDPEKIYQNESWTVEKVVEVIGRAASSQRPKLSLAPGAIQSKSQRASNLGKGLFHAYVAVVYRKSFPADLPDWPAALRKAGEDPEKIYQNESWTVDKVLEVIRRASASERPKLSLASGAIVSKSQRASNLGKDLFHAYAAVVYSKSFPADLPDWPAALRKAGENPADHYQRRSSAGAEEVFAQTETAAEIIRQLRLVPDAGRPEEEVVRDFIGQLEAGDGKKTSENSLNLLTAHREYIAGFRLDELEGRPEEGALLEALLEDSRRVLEHAGGQIGLTPQEADRQLGWETIRRLATALYAARDRQGKRLLGGVHSETLARWFYRELPRRLAPLLAERHRAKFYRTQALEDPFRQGNRRSNAVLADLVEGRLAAGILTDDPKQLQQEAALIKPWIRLLLASNLVDYSKPGFFEELARQPGRTEEERLSRYIEQNEETPFLWRERNERDLDRYLRNVVQASPARERGYLLEVVLGDNNGELALTLKTAEVKLSANPHLRIHLVLKGDNGVMNDASVEDARELLAARPRLYARLLEYQRAGRFRILRGPASHGTPLDRISSRVARSLRRADAVLVEGEANTVMVNGLNADLYLALRLKHPLVIGPVFGLDPTAVTDSPPAFLHIDGRLGRYYSNPFAPLSTGRRLTLEETWARPVRLEVTVPSGDSVEMILPTGEEVLLEYKKGKVVVSALPARNGGLPFFTHRERSLRHGAVWNNTLLKTLRGLPGVQAGQKRERPVEEGIYFFPLPLLTRELLPLETVHRLGREGWAPWEISKELIRLGATPERWRTAAPYVFWDRGPVRSQNGKEAAGELVEIRYQEPAGAASTVSAGAEEHFLQELQEKWPAITLRGRPPSDPLTKRLLLLASATGTQIQRLYPGQVAESRIARIVRGETSLLLDAQNGWIQLWQGEEKTLWANNSNWEWPWIEKRLASKRVKILLEGKDPVERIPLYRQIYEWFQKELKFPAQLTKPDRDALETAAFYISKYGFTAWASAQGVIQVYTQAVPDLDLKKPEERLQFLIATYNVAMKKANAELKEAIQVYTQAVPDLDLKKPEERLQFLIATWQRAVNGMRNTQAPELKAEVPAALKNAAEAVQGSGVVVIDAGVFQKQAGLEEFLKRLPAEGRFIVVGAGSAAGLEVHARNPSVILAAGPVDAAAAILALHQAREKVYVFGSMDLTRLLQLYLRDFLIEVSQLDLRLGLKGILLALGVPEELLRQLDWISVESALSSLEAA